MARHPDRNRLQQIAEYVEKNPGARPAEIARNLGLDRSTVTRSLPELEEQGHLLREDKKGGLWPFRK